MVKIMKLKGFIHYETEVFVNTLGHVVIRQEDEGEERFVMLSSAQALVLADRLTQFASDARQVQGGIEEVDGEE
jgi:hypothetical protein